MALLVLKYNYHCEKRQVDVCLSFLQRVGNGESLQKHNRSKPLFE